MVGCSLTPTQIPEPVDTLSWQERQDQLARFSEWEISGKIGIITEQDSQSASLKWFQEEQEYQIDIRGPWGHGGASIFGKPGDVTIDIAGEGKFHGASPEFIMQERLGWQLPISDIYWWIRGLPAPEKAYQHSLNNNRLKQLNQSGWDIQYLSYNNHLPALPKKMRMSRDGLKVTLVLSSWIPR